MKRSNTEDGQCCRDKGSPLGIEGEEFEAKNESVS